MTVSLEKKVLTNAGLALVLLGALSAVVFWSATRSAATFRQVDQTHRVLYQAESVLVDLLTIQSATRGFLLTGDPRFLAPYETAAAKIEPDIARLGELAADNPAHRPAIATLRQAATEMLALTRERVAVRRRSGLGAAAEPAALLAGKKQMDTVRALIGALEAHERSLLATRSADSQAESARTSFGVAFGGLAAVLFLAVAAWRVFRETGQRVQSEEQLRLTVESVRDYAIIRLDPAGMISSWNAGAQRIKGYAAPEILGRHFSIFYPAEKNAAGFPPQALAVAARDRRFEDHGWRVRRDGSRFWANVVITALHDPAGQLRGFVKVTRDITEQRASQLALSESEARYRALFDSIDEGYCIIELIFDAQQKPVDYRFVVVNPAFEHQTGLRDALGKTMRELAPEHEAYWFETYGRIVLTGEPLRFQNRAAQLHRWFDVFAFRFGDPADRRVAILFNDITRRKEAEMKIAELNTDLRRRTGQLESANRELEAFSYSVSHDLRAPLRHIDGFALLLQKNAPALDAKSRHYLDTISRAAKQMGRLIDDLLSFSRLSRAELRQTRLDQTALVESVVRDLRPAPDHPAVDWVLAPLPAVQADEAMLRQVWCNLLDNAVKYSAKEARPRIEIGGHPDPATGGTVCFVRDNGAGFDPRYQDKLFGVFQRLHSAAEFDGTGIGLALVRRIITRHGGRTWAEGAVGRGATFYFSLPATPVADLQPALPSS
ncbi:MAG: CHASE3 domain-containing protein [Opitutae bacterium]|nr:CHASE3 domain-containing protein [Opitutae bacterium]